MALAIHGDEAGAGQRDDEHLDLVVHVLFDALPRVEEHEDGTNALSELA